MPPIKPPAPMTQACPHCGEKITIVLRKYDFKLNGEQATTPDLSAPGAFLRAFCVLYKKYRNGANYQPMAKRDIPLIRKLLETFTMAHLERMAVVLLTTDDPWTTNTDRSVQVLYHKASWCDDRLKQRGIPG